MSKPRLLNPYLYTFSIFNLWISIVYYRLCRDSVYLAANYIATIDSSGDHWSVYNRSQWWKRNDKPEIAVSHRQNPPTSTSKRRKILVVHYIWSNNSHVLVYKGLLWIMCFDFIKKNYTNMAIYCTVNTYCFRLTLIFLVFMGSSKPTKLSAQQKAHITIKVICKYQDHNFICKRTSQFLTVLHNWYQRKYNIVMNVITIELR